MSENIPVVVGIIFLYSKSFAIQRRGGRRFPLKKVVMVRLMLQDDVAIVDGIATFRLGVRLRSTLPAGYPLKDRGLEVLVRLVSILQAFLRLVVINCG